MKHWKIGDMDTESWNIYQQVLDQKMIKIQNIIQKYSDNPMAQTEIFITKTLDAITAATIDAAKQWVGEARTGQIKKPWINRELIQLMQTFRREKRQIQPILNRIRNLIKYYRIFTRNPHHPLPTKIIKQHLGRKQYEKFRSFNNMDRYKKKRIRMAKRKWLMKQADKMVDKMDTGRWYQTLKQMEDKILNHSERIGRIIKPDVSIKQLDDQQRLKLSNKDYKKNDEETANEVARYMTTIGTNENPGYQNTLLSSRDLARQFDTEFDFKNRNIKADKHKKEMYRLTEEWKMDELLHALHCCPMLYGLVLSELIFLCLR